MLIVVPCLIRNLALTHYQLPKSITGVFLGAEITTPRVRRMIEAHLKDLAAGALSVVIDKRFALRDAAAAHEYIESRAAFGRVVLIP